MGCFDTFMTADGTLSVQLKNGPCILAEYLVGDRVGREFEDGVYYGLEGAVIIRRGIVEAVVETLPSPPDDLPAFTKWGTRFFPESEKLDDRSPFKAVLADLKR